MKKLKLFENESFSPGTYIKYKNPLDEDETNSIYVVIDQGYKETDDRVAFSNVKSFNLPLPPYSVGNKEDFEKTTYKI